MSDTPDAFERAVFAVFLDMRGQVRAADPAVVKRWADVLGAALLEFGQQGAALRVSGAGPDLTPITALVEAWEARATHSEYSGNVYRECADELSAALRVVAVRTQEQENKADTHTRVDGQS